MEEILHEELQTVVWQTSFVLGLACNLSLTGTDVSKANRDLTKQPMKHINVLMYSLPSVVWHIRAS